MSNLPSCSAVTETIDKVKVQIDESKMAKKKFERFSNWVHCICVVTFDLELGQAIEVCVYKISILFCINNSTQD